MSVRLIQAVFGVSLLFQVLSVTAESGQAKPQCQRKLLLSFLYPSDSVAQSILRAADLAEQARFRRLHYDHTQREVVIGINLHEPEKMWHYANWVHSRLPWTSQADLPLDPTQPKTNLDLYGTRFEFSEFNEGFQLSGALDTITRYLELGNRDTNPATMMNRMRRVGFAKSILDTIARLQVDSAQNNLPLQFAFDHQRGMPPRIVVRGKYKHFVALFLKKPYSETRKRYPLLALCSVRFHNYDVSPPTSYFQSGFHVALGPPRSGCVRWQRGDLLGYRPLFGRNGEPLFRRYSQMKPEDLGWHFSRVLGTDLEQSLQ